MSVEQLEEQIRQLPPEDLARLAGWFDSFLGRSMADEADPPADLTESEKGELLRRRDELLANPGSAEPMDDDYFAHLKRDLARARARKASGS